MSLPNRVLAIGQLKSGGLITNYYCTSECAHCLYCCSPRWEKDYIDGETALKNLQKIRSLGCGSIHIGGGEPFLNVEGLMRVVEIACEVNVSIEDVETNSSWFKDIDSACEVLGELKQRGVSTLLVSMSPFHNEHIPFRKVKGVIESCRFSGVSAFPWIRAFYAEIDSFDDKNTHTIAEYESKFGSTYLKMIPSRYWVHFGGRALRTYKGVLEGKSLDSILSSNRRGCQELQDVSHFHVDLFGNYIPGLCSGLAIRRDDLGRQISCDTYPFVSTLFTFGIKGLFNLASNRYGFIPQAHYLTKCHLCLDIRRYLVLEKDIDSNELQPRGFYENA